MPITASGNKGFRPAPRGRTASPQDLARVRSILGDARRRRDLLIEHLHRIQDAEGHLPFGLLVALAEESRLSPAEVYEVASFYHHFEPVRGGETAPPPLTVRVCDSLSCSLAGAESLISALEGGLGRNVRVQRVPCVGRCDAAPVAVVGTLPLPSATVGDVARAVAAGAVADAIPDDAVGYRDYRTVGGYSRLVDLAGEESESAMEQVLSALDGAGLRGLGGAGFPTARKWRAVRSQPAPRLMAVNADEGEPGTFKDRLCLERDPHRFLEGALIAARVVGVEAVYVYLRDEYAGCRALLEREIAALQSDPPCPLPAIHLRRGAGSYVCGEESAMVESIEGKRGVPRLRPPYVAERGLFGRPTLVQNLETLHWLPDILERGAAWFAGHGRRGRQGLRHFSVSGRVRRPGVCLAPAGITVRELIDEHCGGMLDGHRLKAYFPGGASGGILPATLEDLPLDFDALGDYGCFVGSGAVIVLSHRDSVRAAALNAMRFFASESCGQCTPCRVGTRQAALLMARPTWDRERLDDLCRVMEDASICGLGQAAPNPLRCALRYFPEEFA